MNLYISDLHFGHKNVILFEHRRFQMSTRWIMVLCQDLVQVKMRNFSPF